MVRTIIEEALCPACSNKGLQYHAEEIDLPFLGNSLETMLRCDACGYRHTDFLLTDQRDPTRHAYKIIDSDGLMVRVVRSSSGTLRIPELGILIEPGVASEAFISNVEGVIVRVERVLTQLRTDSEAAGDTDSLAKILELEEVFHRIRIGKGQPITLIMDDPMGNSAILHEDVEISPIPEDIARELKVGSFVIDPGMPEEEEEKEETDESE